VGRKLCGKNATQENYLYFYLDTILFIQLKPPIANINII